jgi:uncharacterized protein
VVLVKGVALMAEEAVEKTIQIAMLYDFYGELLTPRQKEILQYYYGENLSLGEIAQELCISRQAVHDTIHKAERSLCGYEEKLGIIERFQHTEADKKKAVSEIEYIINELTGSRSDSSDKLIIERLRTVQDILSRMEG